MRRPCLLFLCLILVLGCGGPKQARTLPRTQRHEAIADPWVLKLTDPTESTPALLWNGNLGLRLSRSSSGLDASGKSLGFFLRDEYEQGGEEKLLALPNPCLVSWAVGNGTFDGDKAKNHDFVKSGGTPLDVSGQLSSYRQELDMRSGILSTTWEQSTPEAGLVKFSCATVLHPTERTVGQRWTIQAQKPTTFSIKSLDYGGPNDPQEPYGSTEGQGLVISTSPKRVVVMQSRLSGANAGAVATVGGFRVQEGTTLANVPVTFERTISFGPRSAKPLPHFAAAEAKKVKALAPLPFTFDDVVSSSKKAWAVRWKTDIEIDGPPADQRAIHSFLFYLRSAIPAGSASSISPFGLSDTQYNGHVFWDADVWVFPALALIDPSEAKAIPSYRLAKSAVAEGNFRKWFKGKNPAIQQPAAGIKFPWESSVSGLETVMGPSRDEEHITGSVLWSLTEAAALGLAPVPRVDRLSALGANYYYSRGTRMPGGKISLDGVMSPDENHTGSNDLYTNLLANWLATGRRWGAPSNALPFMLPKDSRSFITYDGDRFRGYKQAAAVLALYPLQFPEAEAQGKTMMDRFEPNVIPNGPAMSDSVHALLWARIGEPQKAYHEWKNSWEPFTRNPLMLFSEKRTKNQTYFTTGAAGSLQAVLYGFLGFRIDLSAPPGAAWQKPLMGHQTLSVKPNLPPEWKSLTARNLTVLNSRFTVTATHTGVQVTKGE